MTQLNKHSEEATKLCLEKNQPARSRRPSWSCISHLRNCVECERNWQFGDYVEASDESRC